MNAREQESFTSLDGDAADRILAILAGDGLAINGKRVAVIGCSPSGVARRLAELGRTKVMVGFDVKPVGDHSAPERGQVAGEAGVFSNGVRLVRLSTERLSAPASSFDVVVAWHVLEFAQSPLALCKEMERILAKGGVIVVGVSEHLVDGPHRQSSLEEVQRALLAANLIASKVEMSAPVIRLQPRFAHRPFSELASGEVCILASEASDRTLPMARRLVGRVSRSAPTPSGPTDHVAPARAPEELSADWFRSHYDEAPEQILQFLADDGYSTVGQRVADLGCGDGIIDLGVATKGAPAVMRGYDLDATDTAALREYARRFGAAEDLPACLTFERSEPASIPAPDHEYDVVLSWSTFEHVAEPVAMAREIRRVLRPGGVLMLQLYPFYLSEHGAHLWRWFPEGFQHLLRPLEELRAEVANRPPETDPEALATASPFLSGTNVDDLQRALLAGGLITFKVQFIAPPVHIPVALAHFSLLNLAIAGVLLLATPAV